MRAPLSACAALLLAARTFLAAPAETSTDELYRLAKEALSRGSFQTAVRLFRLLEDDAPLEADARFAFNHAQASRFAGNAGEAVYWFTRYLALLPNAPDAATVRADVAKLVQTSARSVRMEAVRRARADYARLVADPELARALRECPRVKLSARFRRTGRADDGTTYLFAARAVLFEPTMETDAPSAVWVSAEEPIVGPDDAPPVLLIPPGRPFRVPLASDVGPTASAFAIPVSPRFPPDASLAEWVVELTAELDRTGPPVLLAPAIAGEALAEVRSGPGEPVVALAKKRREIPAAATPLAYGPRPSDPEAKSWAGARVFVVEIAGKDGVSQRWAAPPGAFTVVNAFPRVVASPSGPERILVRADGQGPFLVPLALAAR